ncbi:MAG: glycoside hydrolase family 16 protein [Acidobacteriota bacterium]
MASALMVEAEPRGVDRSIRVDKITASLPPREPKPDWLGKAPPVPGDWSLTFEENFDGSQIDDKTWNIYTSNFWDKRSHFSKRNVILGEDSGNGVVKLRFERRTGHHNDDPSGKVTNYATGFLDTYGKWVQRYGYFESRMKLPEAPGMWPAFWLMPDRGVEAGPQWKRADTGNGGMEFDIMEFLSRWGKNRHTTAFHWDGYGKNHKATGAAVYLRPDEEGYITSGLLWLPGLAVIYANGKEVARWDTPRISDVQSYIKYTAVSGGWDNDPIDDAQLPADFVIDYVRVWQRADLASDVDGYVAP